MEKDFDNVDKREYHAPILIEYGTVVSITQNGSGSITSDAVKDDASRFGV